MTVMTPAPIDQQQEEEEMLVPHTDLVENNHQPMEEEEKDKAINIGVKPYSWEVNEVVALQDPDNMTLEFLSQADGREAVAKAVNLIFVENLKQHKLGGELDLQILLEPQLNEALQIVGSKGPEPDLLLVYGPVRSHLGFPAWRLRYTEIMLST
ncbi:dehydrodolichyl diphosphate synthase complex subunit nus1-like [Glycine soja]|uniref:dehydrodolichyl diphosphate synthase complex subunit nus1-like n=1 Tax=Glycine soja TaxID=3848 RepID=UPI00103A87B9|nr:dehydrodolichyl diphosphate synthase complex subunit nus1-like [Glycine soja]